MMESCKGLRFGALRFQMGYVALCKMRMHMIPSKDSDRGRVKTLLHFQHVKPDDDSIFISHKKQWCFDGQAITADLRNHV